MFVGWPTEVLHLEKPINQTIIKGTLIVKDFQKVQYMLKWKKIHGLLASSYTNLFRQVIRE